MAVEKALKSWLIRRSIPFPKIHDLVALYNLLPLAQRDAIETTDLEVINPWSLAGRYPDDLMEADKEEARQVVRAARRIVEAIGEHVG